VDVFLIKLMINDIEGYLSQILTYVQIAKKLYRSWKILSTNPLMNQLAMSFPGNGWVALKRRTPLSTI
jgi:hypothetical protein